MASDLAWAMPETRGECRREQNGIPGKENSPRKGPEIRVYDAFVCVLLSHVLLFATPWAVARQAPLSVEFSRQDYCSG